MKETEKYKKLLNFKHIISFQVNKINFLNTTNLGFGSSQTIAIQDTFVSIYIKNTYKKLRILLLYK